MFTGLAALDQGDGLKELIYIICCDVMENITNLQEDSNRVLAQRAQREREIQQKSERLQPVIDNTHAANNKLKGKVVKQHSYMPSVNVGKASYNDKENVGQLL
ncbi:hypothetical protein Dimus_024059 [Dionaea muscipula]